MKMTGQVFGGADPRETFRFHIQARDMREGTICVFPAEALGGIALVASGSGGPTEIVQDD